MNKNEIISRIMKSQRGTTFQRAIDIATEKEFETIVETGCTRSINPVSIVGDGFSSYLFAAYADDNNARFYTVDMVENNMNKCKFLTKRFEESVEYVVQDSVQFLKDFDKTIDLLYLDSFDCFQNQIGESQKHQMNELLVALPKLSTDAIILLDDYDASNAMGGKCGISVPYLLDNGWKIEVENDKQILFVRDMEDDNEL